MRINEVNTQILVNRYGKTEKTHAPGQAGAAAGGTDRVALSSEAQGWLDALKAAKDSDPVNLQKVEDVSRRIARGAYSVSAREVADSMLKDGL